jgi:hypothetical protein
MPKNENIPSNQETLQVGNALEKELLLFIGHIDSLADTFPITMQAIDNALSKVLSELGDFTREFGKITEMGEGGTTYEVDANRVNQLQKILSQLSKTSIAVKIHPRSFIVSLISHYDAYLGRLIAELFILQPSVLNSSEKNISFSDLVSFGSVETAKEFVIEKEIESVLRGSHIEQFDWLERKFSIPLNKGLEIWPKFIELTERRNLFVHTDGKVSNQYLSVCRKYGVELNNEVKLGEILEVTPEYWQAAYECVFEIAVKLTHVLWRKLAPQDRLTADENLNTICYSLIMDKNYKLARILLDFACDLKKFADETKERMLIINRAQVYKWLNMPDETRRILASRDWSATSDKFKLAKAVLLDDYSEADKIVKRIGKNGEMKKQFYRDWPLFQEYRKSASFSTLFKDIFGEPLNLVNIPNSEVTSASKLAESLNEIEKAP